MNKILVKERFSEKVYKLVVEAPLIARARKAGNFVIIRTDQEGERIPLTIATADKEKGTITLVVQAVGYSTIKLCNMNVGDSLADIVGPLGKPTDIQNFGTVVCAGGGVGVAPMLPIVEALKKAGNKVISVLAGRTKELIILEEQIREHSDEVIIMTDDGSYGNKGLVTEGIESVIKREKVDKCFAIGPAIMMKFVCLLTKKYGIPTDVSLNTIMVDGTGMCGACRITVGGKTKFVCIDGPEFDGHEVDFDEMLQRMGAYREAEQEEIKLLGEEEAEGRDAEWRVNLRKSVKPKERMQIERVEMPELPPSYRAHSLYEEVNRGLSKEQAKDLMSINDDVESIYRHINLMLREGDFSEIETVLTMRDQLFESIAEAIKSELTRINEARSNTKASMLYLTILTETKNMVLQSRNLLKSQQYFLKHLTGPKTWIK